MSALTRADASVFLTQRNISIAIVIFLVLIVVGYQYQNLIARQQEQANELAQEEAVQAAVAANIAQQQLIQQQQASTSSRGSQVEIASGGSYTYVESFSAGKHVTLDLDGYYVNGTSYPRATECFTLLAPNLVWIIGPSPLCTVTDSSTGGSYKAQFIAETGGYRLTLYNPHGLNSNGYIFVFPSFITTN